MEAHFVRHFVFRRDEPGPSPQNVNRHCPWEHPVIYTPWRGAGASCYSLTDRNSPVSSWALWLYRIRTSTSRYFLLNHRNQTVDRPTSELSQIWKIKRIRHGIEPNPAVTSARFISCPHTHTTPRLWGELSGVCVHISVCGGFSFALMRWIRALSLQTHLRLSEQGSAACRGHIWLFGSPPGLNTCLYL